MIPTIPVALTAAPATAAIATTGLEPLLWVTVGLMAAAAALILHEAWTWPGVPRERSNSAAAPRRRLQIVRKQPGSVIRAA